MGMDVNVGVRVKFFILIFESVLKWTLWRSDNVENYFAKNKFVILNKTFIYGG